MHARAVLAAGRRRQLVGVVVEQRRVVVVLDVVDHLRGLGREAGRLVGVDEEAVEPAPRAVAQRRGVAGQRAGQPGAHEVALGHQVVPRASLAERVGVQVQPVDEALLGHQRAAAVERPATAHGVARERVEAADARAAQAPHRGLHEARTVGDLAEVPALADQLHRAAGSGVDGTLQPLHRRPRLVPHDVEAEAADAVVARPDDDRVGHQLLHHPVLGGRVVAAGGGLHRAAGVQPVVVPGHDAVQHRLGVLARGRRVVVDDVHAHAQAGAVQRLHHRAELGDAAQRVAGVGGVP